MSNEYVLRRALLDTARALSAAGLNKGSAGNVSVRCGEGFLITPSGLSYARTAVADIVPMALDGQSQGLRPPSSEWRFHRDIYVARPEAGAVVHTHSPFATALACLEREIPAFHYMIARFGGSTLRCAPYATFGTQLLSDYALTALQDRSACLLGHHGMLVFGGNLEDAMDAAVELETLCEQYWRALQIGQPASLPEEEMRLVLEKFKTYGRPEKVMLQVKAP